ncbi:helix-turn-helix domain-containing protein [Sphingobacterium sp. LRF_L2]|uniref:helix-turn-helix domain-containing protein n=1 Tax=Sphingobacterium sp. LRF_L2 TaxID=3369421 RepID=UPI003F5D8C75
MEINRNNLQNEEFIPFSEKETEIISTAGGIFRFQETSFDGLQFVKCNYSLLEKEKLHIHIEKEVLEMHFRLQGTSQIHRSKSPIHLEQGNNMLTYQRDDVQKVILNPVEYGTFLEIRIGKSQFEKFMHEDIVQSTRNLFSGSAHQITPTMRLLIADMTNNRYQGKMKALFLESKMTELFLLQLQQKSAIRPQSNTLKKSEIELLYAIKEYITRNKYNYLSLDQLSKQFGINKTKLMRGFKGIFGQTIYQYIVELKLNSAKSMLINEDKFVNEVAYEIGYKNPQHFVEAFKKRFGISPGKLKSK